MAKLSEAINKLIAETLYKNETMTMQQVLGKIGEALSVDIANVKEILADDSKITQEQITKIAEALGVTAEDLKVTEEAPKQQPVADPLGEAIKATFGETNELVKRLDELKKIIEQNEDKDTVNYMTEITRKVIEIVPIAVMNSADRKAFETLVAETKSLKEQVRTLTTGLEMTEAKIKQISGLSETVKKQIEGINHRKSKGIYETQGGDKTGTTPELLYPFEDLSLTRILQ